MSDLSIRSSTLAENLKCSPPSLVFHYTSASGVIGILDSKEMWATNVSFLNDANELVEAANVAKNIIENMINRGGYLDQELTLLHAMKKIAGSAPRRYYVCSFSEVGDSLLHWRAYCPTLGGYAIGFPAKHLSKLATEQGWYFVKCVYDNNEKYRIISEIIDSFIHDFRKQGSQPVVGNEQVKHLSWQFAQYLAQIGATIKHGAFSSEAEWRIISPRIHDEDARIGFRSRLAGIVPYCRFALVTKMNPHLAKHEDQHLVLRCGPTNERHQAQHAAQMILTRYLGGAAHGGSDVPLRRG